MGRLLEDNFDDFSGWPGLSSRGPPCAEAGFAGTADWSRRTVDIASTVFTTG